MIAQAEPHSIQHRTRRWIKQRIQTVDRWLHASSPADLTRAIRAMGVRPGDVMMVHSSFGQMRFFEGTALDAIAAMLESVGSQGTLVMPTFPFKHRSYEYLSARPVFDPQRSPAYTGLLCELFRRRPDAVRSLHPSHPVAAVGPMAEYITSGYENSTTPFDHLSPWHKMSEMNAWILNVGLAQRELAITQYHYAEEVLREFMPVSLYWPEPFEVTIKANGVEKTLKAYAHHPQSKKNYRRIIAWHHQAGILRRSRVGAIELWACRAGELLDATAVLARRGCTVFSDEGWDALEANEIPALVKA